MHHLIRCKKVDVPHPRVQRKCKGILNISSWIWHLNKKNPDECKSYLSNIFKESQWEEDDENVHTFEKFRDYVIDDKVVKRQPPFVFECSN